MNTTRQATAHPFLVLVLATVLGAGVAAGAGATGQPVSKPLKPGFPVTLSGGGIMVGGHPTVADLGLTPGHQSLVFCTTAQKLFVIEYNGTVAPGFPVSLPGECYGSTVAVGPILGNGSNQIVVAYGSFSPVTPGGVSAYTAAGTLIWARPSGDFNSDNVPDGVVDAPAIADVDHDGVVEVAWGSLDGNVYLVDGATGANKPGWPKFVRDTIFSSPALFDLDGDGNMEIIIGADAHQEGAPYNTPNGGCLHALRPANASELAGFPICENQVLTSSPAVGDINGDGLPEIVVGTGQYPPYMAGATHAVYAFEPNGAAAPGWPVATDGEVFTSPALADINGDGNPEVIVTDNADSPSTTYHVYAFKGDGTMLWKTQPKSFFGNTPDAGDPVVADVAGDSHLEILTAVNTEISVLDANGHQLTDDGTHFAGSFSYYTENAVRAAYVNDWETDGLHLEVATVSALGTAATSDTKVYVWNPQPPTTYPWPTIHQNPQHVGVAVGTPAVNPGDPTKFYTLAPCRIVDTRNPTGPYGAPALSANSARNFTLGGQCGVPTTATAVSANITAVTPSAAGYINCFAATGTVPGTYLVSYNSGAVLAVQAIVGLMSGQVTCEAFQASGTAQLLIDVNGYYQ